MLSWFPFQLSWLTEVKFTSKPVPYAAYLARQFLILRVQRGFHARGLKFGINIVWCVVKVYLKFKLAILDDKLIVNFLVKALKNICAQQYYDFKTKFPTHTTSDWCSIHVQWILVTKTPQFCSPCMKWANQLLLSKLWSNLDPIEDPKPRVSSYTREGFLASMTNEFVHFSHLFLLKASFCFYL